MAVPPVAVVYWAGATAMAGLVLEAFVPSSRSVAVRVKLPLALKATVRLVVPAASAVAAGRVALMSLELRPTVSLTLLTRFQKASTALTVTAKLLPTIWPLGVPVLPLAVPGAALSPGTSNCNWAKAAGLTRMLAEAALVRPLLEKLRLTVLATLCERLTNVTTPFTAVALKVPCKVPLPALRAAVTTVVLSLERRLP